MKAIELPIEEIIEKYENGIIQSKIAEQYGVTQALISKRIREYYKETGKQQPKRIYYKKELPEKEIGKERPKHKAGTKRKELPIEDIIRRYEKGISSQRELAKEYGVTYETMSKRIKEYCQAIGRERPKRNQDGRKTKKNTNRRDNKKI